VFVAGIILAFLLAAYGVLGVFAVILGHLMSMMLRLRWSGHSAAVDAALAVSVALGCVLAMGWLEADSRNGVIWADVLSLLSVILRHIARLFASGRGTRTAG
jgi:hypothetical protein